MAVDLPAQAERTQRPHPDRRAAGARRAGGAPYSSRPCCWRWLVCGCAGARTAAVPVASQHTRAPDAPCVTAAEPCADE